MKLLFALLCWLLPAPAAGTSALSNPVRTIERFYAGVVFGDEDADEAVGRCCTGKLRRQLRDAWPYDGEGYAVWLFRSGMQDGPGDRSETISVESLGDGRYRVSFVDMGTEGCRILTLVERDGTWLFDAVE